MLRVLLALVILAIATPAKAFFFPGTGGGSPSQALPSGILSESPLFDRGAGMTLIVGGSVVAGLRTDDRISTRTHFWASMRKGEPPEAQFYALTLDGTTYTAAPAPQEDPALAQYFKRDGAPFGGLAFTLHRQPGHEDRLIAQVAPGDGQTWWSYHPLRLDAAPDGTMIVAYELVFSDARAVVAALTAAGHGVAETDLRFTFADRAALEAVLGWLETEKTPMFASGPFEAATHLQRYIVASTPAARADVRARIWSSHCITLGVHPLDPGLLHSWLGVPEWAIDEAHAVPACALARAAGLHSEMAQMAATRVALLAARNAGDVPAQQAAKEEYRKAAAGGNPLAVGLLALLELGLGMPEPGDRATGVQMLLDAVDGGNAIAAYLYGVLIQTDFLPDDRDRPLPVLMQAAIDAGIEAAHEPLGRHWAGAGRWEDAARAYRAGAAVQDPESQLALAWLTYRGQGTVQDHARARGLFDQAGRHGLAEALYLSGFMRFYGQGGAQDYGLAQTYLRQAVERGNVAAKAELGAIMALGLAGRAEIAAGIALLNEAEAAGVASAPAFLDRVRAELSLGNPTPGAP